MGLQYTRVTLVPTTSTCLTSLLPPLLPFTTQPLSTGPVLALAIGGVHACSRLESALGPRDAKLARRTDPHSLRARFGGETREPTLLDASVRSGPSAAEHLARWFGPRPASASALTAATKLTCPALVLLRRSQRCRLTLPGCRALSELALALGTVAKAGLTVVAAGQPRGTNSATSTSSNTSNTASTSGTGSSANASAGAFVLVLSGPALAAILPTLALQLGAVAHGSIDTQSSSSGSSGALGLLGVPPRSVVEARLAPAVAAAASHTALAARLGGVEQGRALAVPRVPSAAVVAISRPRAGTLARLCRALEEEGYLQLLGSKVLADVEMTQAREVSPYEAGDKRWKPSLASIARWVHGAGLN